MQPGDIARNGSKGRSLIIVGSRTRISSDWKKEKLREVWSLNGPIRRKFWILEDRLHLTGKNIHKDDPFGGI